MRCYKIIVILIFLWVPLKGQIKLTSFAGGAKTGTSLFFLKGADESRIQYLNDKFNSINSPFLGLQFQTNLSRLFLLNIDFQFSIKGQSYENNNAKTINQRYLYLDFMPSTDLNVNQYFKIGFGPYLSTKITDKSDLSSYMIGIYGRNWDYGLNFSMTIVINKVSVRFSHLYGLHHVFFTGLPSPKFKHRSFQLGIGYSWWQRKIKNKKSS